LFVAVASVASAPAAALTALGPIAAIPTAGSAAGLGQSRDHLAARHVAVVDPHFDADGPVGRESRGQAVVHVRAQRVERDAAFAGLFDPGDLRAVEPATHADAD